VNIELVLLGLASALRPSSLVAVYALVRERSPSRLMAAYVIAGLAFVFAVGAVVLLVFSGIELKSGTRRTKGIAELAAGILALGLGLALLLGRARLEKATSAPGPSGRLERLRRREFSTRTAAVAGAATHIPGLLYLLALDLIVSQEPDLGSELVSSACTTRSGSSPRYWCSRSACSIPKRRAGEPVASSSGQAPTRGRSSRS
jgi:MFS family permease